MRRREEETIARWVLIACAVLIPVGLLIELVKRPLIIGGIAALVALIYGIGKLADWWESR